MALHLPEVAEFFNDEDLNQFVDRAKNDAAKNTAKVKYILMNDLTVRLSGILSYTVQAISDIFTIIFNQ